MCADFGRCGDVWEVIYDLDALASQMVTTL